MALILPRAPSPSRCAYDTLSPTEAHSGGGWDITSSQPEASRSQSPVRDSDACSATTAALLEQLATGYRELWDQALDVLVSNHVFESEEGLWDDVLKDYVSSLSEAPLCPIIEKINNQLDDAKLSAERALASVSLDLRDLLSLKEKCRMACYAVLSGTVFTQQDLAHRIASVGQERSIGWAMYDDATVAHEDADMDGLESELEVLTMLRRRLHEGALPILPFHHEAAQKAEESVLPLLNPDISQAFSSFAHPSAPLAHQPIRCASPDVLQEEAKTTAFAAYQDPKDWRLYNARFPGILRCGTGCSLASSARSRSLDSITYVLRSRQTTQTEWDGKMRGGGLDSLAEQVD